MVEFVPKQRHLQNCTEEEVREKERVGRMKERKRRKEGREEGKKCMGLFVVFLNQN